MREPDPFHPSRRMIAAAVAAAAVLWTGAIVLLSTSDDALDVAERYLTALSRGDAESAQRLIAEDALNKGALLTGEGLTNGWVIEDAEVTASEKADGRDNEWTVWTVDYTIRYGDQVASGELKVSDREGDVRIDTPYVYTTLWSGLDFVEINDVLYRPSEGDWEGYLYPGVYRFFKSHPDIVDPSRGTILVVADGTGTSVDLSEKLEDSFVVSADLQADLDQQIRSLVDECVELAEIAAPGCFFGAPAHDRGELAIGLSDYENVSDLNWEVEFYPVVELQPSLQGLWLTTKVEGSIILTAVGSRVFDADETLEEIEELCRIRPSVEAEITEEGDLVLTVGTGPTYSC